MREILQWLAGPPAFPKRGFDCGGLRLAAREEFSMRTLLAVVGLFGWRAEQCLHQTGVEIEEKGSVEQNPITAPSLGISRHLRGIDGQISKAFDLNGPAQDRGQRLGIALHDKRIGARDALEKATSCRVEKERVIQAPWPLQHRPASATPPEDRNAALPASLQIHLQDCFIAMAQHHEMFQRFPDPQNLTSAPPLAPIEQSLVTRDIFRRSRKRKIQIIHCAVAM